MGLINTGFPRSRVPREPRSRGRGESNAERSIAALFDGVLVFRLSSSPVCHRWTFVAR
jgi:hypothetical protein